MSKLAKINDRVTTVSIMGLEKGLTIVVGLLKSECLMIDYQEGEFDQAMADFFDLRKMKIETHQGGFFDASLPF